VSATGTRLSAAIVDFSYQPARLTIRPGTTVVWNNRGQVAHTVTAEDRSFDTGEIDSGQTGSLTFARPGTYRYYCTPHPFMKGEIVVR
jgi:plastocyanin